MENHESEAAALVHRSLGTPDHPAAWLPPRRAACVSPCRIIGSAAATRFRTLRDPGAIRTPHHSPRRRLYVQVVNFLQPTNRKLSCQRIKALRQMCEIIEP